MIPACRVPCRPPWRSHLPERSASPVHRKTCYLQPGQLVACTEPTAVTTVLGSCVSVCLWDRRLTIGAVNHYVLPDAVAAQQQFSTRFGRFSMTQLIGQLRALGSAAADLEAKMFGGAGVLVSQLHGLDLGASNVKVARQHLAAVGVPLVAEDVGGRRGRRLVFHTDTGLAFVREL